jgi:hypothetical protein
MPELKKVFTAGKMNKDLDERLVPNGEYREAQNIQIASSEDSDVGAIENVLGNKLAYQTAYDSTVGNTCIGSYVDTANDRIFWFTTDFDNPAQGTVYTMTRATSSNKMAIIMKDGNSDPITLVTGHFLNFNKSYLITGVNVLEDYLFWTDDYNQPRGIDIRKVDPSHPNYVNGYYDCEEKISVGKIAPYQEPLLAETNATASTTHSRGDATTLLRDGDVKSDYMQERFIRFAYRYKYKDGQYSIISPFTQSVFKPLNAGVISRTPDQYNSTTANTGTGDEPKVPISLEDIYERTTLPIMQNAYNKVTMRIPLPNLDEFAGGANPSSTYSNPFDIESIEILLKESDGLAVKIVDTIQMDASPTIGSYYIPIKSKTVVANGANSGDAVLEVDAHNGVEAGWIIDNMSTSVLGSDGRLYVVSVDTSANTITLNGNIAVSDDASLVFKKVYWRQTVEYTYTAEKPYKVLPENQLIRVSDKIPVRAKAQEVVSNRLVYGNITQNYPIPVDTSNRKGIDYTVNDQAKGENENGQVTGILQLNKDIYKYHNLKQRRTYKVGIVLSDIYGRKSPVILSTHTSTDLSDTFTTSTITTNFDNYYNSDTYSWNSNFETVGRALAINFQDDYIVDSNKVYNKTTNPNGWYSWRVVVKQTEQDYYNIYTQHPINSWTSASYNAGSTNTIPGKVDTGNAGRSWLTLYGDNANKVPRSVHESDETRDGVSGSEVQLYPKVVQDTSNVGSGSKMGNANQEYIDVISIGTAIDQGLASNQNSGNTGTARTRVYGFVVDGESNPLVAELPNLRVEPVGVTTGDASINSSAISGYWPADYPATPSNIGLTVFETKPFESDIDIFYETSTGGLIQDLNEIIAAAGVGPTNIACSATSFAESLASGQTIGNLSADAYGGASITSFSIVSAKDGNNDDYTTSFQATNDSGWKLKTQDTFAFHNDVAKDTFTITIKCTQSDAAFSILELDINVTNSAPTCGTGSATLPISASAGYNLGSVQATNGSANTTLNKLYLTVNDVTGQGVDCNNPPAVESNFAATQTSNGTITLKTTAAASTIFGAANSYGVQINVEDNGGLKACGNFNITRGQNSVATQVYSSSDIDNICNFSCLAYPYTVYIAKGASTDVNGGGAEPDSMNIYVGNIIYMNPQLTIRLFQGSNVSGGIVWTVNNSKYHVANGVITAALSVCPEC